MFGDSLACIGRAALSEYQGKPVHLNSPITQNGLPFSLWELFPKILSGPQNCSIQEKAELYFSLSVIIPIQRALMGTSARIYFLTGSPTFSLSAENPHIEGEAFGLGGGWEYGVSCDISTLFFPVPSSSCKPVILLLIFPSCYFGLDNGSSGQEYLIWISLWVKGWFFSFSITDWLALPFLGFL